MTFPLLVGTYVFNDPHETKGVWGKLAGGMYTEYWLSRKYDGQYPVFGELNTYQSFPILKYRVLTILKKMKINLVA